MPLAAAGAGRVVRVSWAEEERAEEEAEIEEAVVMTPPTSPLYNIRDTLQTGAAHTRRGGR